MGKKRITELPLAPSLPQFLRPDPALPNLETVLGFSKYRSSDSPNAAIPSNMRRSRQIRGGGHFSWTTPLPLSFPYRVPDEQVPDPPLRKVDGEAVGDGSDAVEKAERKEDEESSPERSRSRPTTPKAVDVEQFLATLEPSLDHPIASSSKLFTSSTRQKLVGRAELLALSKNCAADLLPDLDVESDEGKEELIQLLSGRALYADKQAGFGPWSLCYGGHQFGSWAGQLGDGRAISVFVTPSPAKSTDGVIYPPVAELQLKGAGRTPYSRFADGLAVLRSSVREFLGSEAMAALKIPTSRALSLINLPDIPVAREQLEAAAIVCRVAPSWLRIGSFEIQRDRREWDSLLELASYVSKHLFGLEQTSAAGILKQVSERNAKTFAAWQAYGFMHGVLNTDNISLLGLTIDYGPYAFMDIFDENKICNHSDDLGRYSYRMQPSMGVFAVQKLGDALAELIGAELEAGKEGVKAGWATGASNTQLNAWTSKGQEIVVETKRDFTRIFTAEYKRLMRLRLGIKDEAESDFNDIIVPLTEMMEEQKLDYSQTLRTLATFEGSSSKDTVLDQLKRGGPSRKEWSVWLDRYAQRVSASVEERKKVNPRFVLRQWVLEETIKRCEKEPDFLRLVLDMATSPFEEYAEGEQARLCGIGSEDMLGFQCSCSS